MWDPVHMYNAIVNEWQDVERQITFDVRQPKTHAFTLERLRSRPWYSGPACRHTAPSSARCAALPLPPYKWGSSGTSAGFPPDWPSRFWKGKGGQMEKKGRVTIPTDIDVIEDTIKLAQRWGADACNHGKACSLSLPPQSLPRNASPIRKLLPLYSCPQPPTIS